MKNFYLFALALAPFTFNAQETFTFEANDYEVGPIHGQKGWETTLNWDDEPIHNQSITDELAFESVQSLKIDVDEDEDFLWFPMFGAAKQLEKPYNYRNTVFEFDTYVSELNGSNFEYTAWGIKNDEFVPVGLVGFNYEGYVEVITDTEYSYQQTDFYWQPETWYHVKMEFSENQIKYYVNNELIYTGENYAQTNIEGINFLHDNFAGYALIDNIRIDDSYSATQSVTKGNIKVYPNPTADVVNIELPKGEKVHSVEVYSVAGQKMIAAANDSKIGLKHLPAGTYVVKATTQTGKAFSQKVIKK